MLMSVSLQCYKTDAEKKNHHSIFKAQGNVSQVTAKHRFTAFINPGPPSGTNIPGSLKKE